jgi:hypothetical protein
MAAGTEHLRCIQVSGEVFYEKNFNTWHFEQNTALSNGYNV